MDKLNKWLSLFANLGVVGGLIFLAVELNQNTQATITSASAETTNQALEFFSLGLDNQIVARSLYKRSIGEDLDGFEANQIWRYQFYNFRIFENAFMQFQRGYFDESEWTKYRRIISGRLANDPLAQQMWEESRGLWTAEFETEVADILENERAAIARDALNR
jgi:hypothetical protein